MSAPALLWQGPVWWARRSSRERLLLGLLVGALAVYVGIVAITQPLLKARRAALDEIARHETALAQLETAPEGGAARVAIDNRPVPAVVTDTAPGFDLAIRRIEPEGGGARVVVEDASFAQVLSWIAALEREHGLRLAAVEMDRRPEPGTVSARLTLER